MRHARPLRETVFWILLLAANLGGVASLFYFAREYHEAVGRGMSEGVAGAFQISFSLPIAIALALFDAVALVLWWSMRRRPTA